MSTHKKLQSYYIREPNDLFECIKRSVPKDALIQGNTISNLRWGIENGIPIEANDSDSYVRDTRLQTIDPLHTCGYITDITLKSDVIMASIQMNYPYEKNKKLFQNMGYTLVPRVNAKINKLDITICEKPKPIVAFDLIKLSNSKFAKYPKLPFKVTFEDINKNKE